MRSLSGNRCANCGTLAKYAKKLITGGWMCDEEFVCCDACYKQLEKLGCPHETGDNYRPRPQEALDHEFERLSADNAVIKAARGALELLTALKVRELLDEMCGCDPDVGFICFGCAMATELAATLAALDEGGAKS